VTHLPGKAGAAEAALLEHGHHHAETVTSGRLGRHVAGRGTGGDGTAEAPPALSAGPEPMPRAAAQPGRSPAMPVIPPRPPRAGPGAAAARQLVPASDAARWRASLRSADRARCCPARPLVIAVMPPASSQPHPTELLLCRHHYRAHMVALAMAGAAVYEADAVTPARAVAEPAPLS